MPSYYVFIYAYAYFMVHIIILPPSASKDELSLLY